MSLSDKQWMFLQNIAKLIQYAESIGIKLTAGEAYRTQDQQILYYYGKRLEVRNHSPEIVDGKKRSWTMYSQHRRRLAMDFNFFVDGELTYDYEKIKPLGEYWESLHPDNRWGGNFKAVKDTPHFEMKG